MFRSRRRTTFLRSTAFPSGRNHFGQRRRRRIPERISAANNVYVFAITLRGPDLASHPRSPFSYEIGRVASSPWNRKLTVVKYRFDAFHSFRGRAACDFQEAPNKGGTGVARCCLLGHFEPCLRQDPVG